jgi:hypothetical protein
MAKAGIWRFSASLQLVGRIASLVLDHIRCDCHHDVGGRSSRLATWNAA